ncbi:MAG: hypothetical protein RSE56_02235 [Bacilli bacterium]
MNVLKEKKIKVMQTVLFGGALVSSSIVSAHAQLGDYIEPAANSVQSEALSVLNIGGVVGIVVGAFMIILGKRKEGGIVAMSTISGYLIIKYGAEIWSLLTGSV